MGSSCPGASRTYSQAHFITTAVQGGCVTVFKLNEIHFTADAIPLNAPITAAIAAIGDIDFYLGKLGSFSNLCSALITVPAGIDYELYLYNSAGTQIDSYTNNAGMNDSISVPNQPADV